MTLSILNQFSSLPENDKVNFFEVNKINIVSLLANRTVSIGKILQLIGHQNYLSFFNSLHEWRSNRYKGLADKNIQVILPSSFIITLFQYLKSPEESKALCEYLGTKEDTVNVFSLSRQLKKSEKGVRLPVIIFFEHLFTEEKIINYVFSFLDLEELLAIKDFCKAIYGSYTMVYEKHVDEKTSRAAYESSLSSESNSQSSDILPLPFFPATTAYSKHIDFFNVYRDSLHSSCLCFYDSGLVKWLPKIVEESIPDSEKDVVDHFTKIYGSICEAKDFVKRDLSSFTLKQIKQESLSDKTVADALSLLNYSCVSDFDRTKMALRIYKKSLNDKYSFFKSNILQKIDGFLKWGYDPLFSAIVNAEIEDPTMQKINKYFGW